MPGMSLHGLLNTGLLGVYTAKSAMSVVGHNIANANTPGFSRQRPEIVSTPSLPMNTLTQTSAPMQFGTGSKIEDIKRVRDQFLDIQYRQTNNRVSYWDNIYGNMHYIEQLFGEPGETGIRNLFDNLWGAMQELSSDPTNEGAKGQIVSRTDELANTLKDLDFRLSQLQGDFNTEIENRVVEINNYFERITDLNGKIRSIKVSGSSPNDLLDERDRILDQLSELADIHVNHYSSGDISIRIGDRTLLNGSTYQELKAYTVPGTEGYYNIFANNNPVKFNDGKMAALFELRDSIVPQYRGKIDEFAITLADTMNLVHEEGFDGSGSITGAQFFKDIGTNKETELSRLYRIASSFGTHLNNPDVEMISSNRKFNAGNLSGIELLRDATLVQIDSSNTPPANSVDISSALAGNGLDSFNTGFMENIFSYEPANDLLTFKNTTGNPLSEKMIIDVDKSFLNDYGFNTRSVSAYRIEQSDIQSGTVDFNIDGSNITINLDGSTTGDFVFSINNAPGNNYIRAFGHDGAIYITASEQVQDGDISNIVFNDPDGVFSGMNMQEKEVDVLDVSNPPMRNIYDGGPQLEINGMGIDIDLDTDTINDVVDKINSSNTGVSAFITPNGRFVLKGSQSIDMDLRNSSIKGSVGFFNALGITNNTTDPANTQMTLVSSDMNMDQINSTLKNADILKLDQEIGIVNKLDVLDGIRNNPSNIAIDLGKFDYSTGEFEFTGPNNPSVWEELSNIKDTPLLNDGKDGFNGFLSNLIAEMGIRGETANKMHLNSKALNDQIDIERERVKGVSIDEEMSNMIKYQQAFNASARVVTAVDEMLNKVVNSLGIVGR